MVDENEFKQTYAQLNRLPCPFEKAILSNCCSCSQSIRILIGNREAGGCKSNAAQQQCQAFLDILHKKAAFAVGHKSIDGPLPHSKEIKIQCGGLIGLHKTLDQPETVDKAGNVTALINSAIDEFGGIEQLPYSELMRTIVHYSNRRQRGSNIP